MSGEKRRYVTVSLPTGITQEIDFLMEELGYWPSRGAFVREACLEKIREEQRRLRELREFSESVAKTPIEREERK